MSAVLSLILLKKKGAFIQNIRHSEIQECSQGFLQSPGGPVYFEGEAKNPALLSNRDG